LSDLTFEYLIVVVSISPLEANCLMHSFCFCCGPSYFGWILTEDPDQGYVMVECAAPAPSSIPKVETYTSNESSIVIIVGLLE